MSSSNSLGIESCEEGIDLELKPRSPCEIRVMDFEEKYELLEELGKGMFGVVKKCRSKSSGEVFAAKIVRKTAKSKIDVVREIAMMNQLHHKKLAQIYDAFETSRQMVIIMEYIAGEELFEKIVQQENHTLTELQVVRYLKQILYGVQHMHSKYIVHLDLKPENILCLHGGSPGYEEIKLIDFGLAREVRPGSSETVICGTPEFVAPEVISYEPVSMASDMWSLGVITYILLSGESPFLGDDDNETLQNVTAGDYDFDDEEGVFDNVSEDAKKFITKLLILNPKKRMSVDACLEHDWFVNKREERVLDTSKLKKYLTRRKWKKTINAIKAVGRFSLGLSMLRESVKNNKKDTNATPTAVQGENRVSAPKLSEAHKNNGHHSSCDEGISDANSDGDIAENTCTESANNGDNIVTSEVEDSGCFESVDFNSNITGGKKSKAFQKKNNSSWEIVTDASATIQKHNEDDISTKESRQESNKTEKTYERQLSNILNKEKEIKKEKLFSKSNTVNPRNSKITKAVEEPTKSTTPDICHVEKNITSGECIEKRKISFLNKLTQNNWSKNNEKRIQDKNSDKLKYQILSPTTSRRNSNLLPSQLKQSENNDLNTLQKSFDRASIARKSARECTRNFSSRCRSKIDENGNYTGNKTPILRKKSMPANIKLSSSVKDRMTVFQGK